MKVCTFNLLAPCNNRLSGSSRKESSQQKVYLDRQTECLQLILETQASICFLQEFWFELNIDEVYRSLASRQYLIKKLKRPGSKQDGLVTLVERDMFEVLAEKELVFGDVGQRCALFLLLKNANRHFLAINVHLTAPKSPVDIENRKEQVESLVQVIEEYTTSLFPIKPFVIVAGDFNFENENDPLLKFMLDSGLQNCAGQSETSFVTHKLSNGQFKVSDYIFYQNPTLTSNMEEKEVEQKKEIDHVNFAPIELIQYQCNSLTVGSPRYEFSSTSWPPSYSLSDHALVESVFSQI